MEFEKLIDKEINSLLHIDDIEKNVLIDINANISLPYLNIKSVNDYPLINFIFDVIKQRYGKIANTILLGSATNPQEQIVGNDLQTFDWDINGEKNTTVLNKFINDIYKTILNRGHNPLFLSIGSLKWKVSAGDKVKDVRTPFLIVPVKLVRGLSQINPISIEFVPDDIYINPCLLLKLENTYGREIVDDLLLKLGLNNLGEVNLNDLNFDLIDKANNYFNNLDSSANTLFKFDMNKIYIAAFKSSDICMYQDLKRNRIKILNNRLVKNVYGQEKYIPNLIDKFNYLPILPNDLTQQNIMINALEGESLIIKGPPGTGKTLTIANLIANLIANKKKVLFSSTKVAALNEVYKKLPPELRMFVLLLEFEKEEEVANQNPNKIKKDLKLILDNKDKYVAKTNLIGELNSLRISNNKEVNKIKEYEDFMFNNKKIFSNNLYEALLILGKTNIYIPLNYENVLSIDLLKYNELFNKIKDLKTKALRLIINGSIKKSLFYNASLKEDLNVTFKIINNIISILEKYNNLDNLRILEFIYLAKNLEEIKKLKSLIKNELFNKLENFNYEFKYLDIIKENTPKIDYITLDITIKDFILIKEYRSLFKIKYDNDTILRVNYLNKKIKNLKEVIDLLFNQIYGFYGTNLKTEFLDNLNKQYMYLLDYKEDDSLKLFDFKAKKAYNMLKNSDLIGELKFGDVIKVVNIYDRLVKSQNELNVEIINLNKELGQKVVDKEGNLDLKYINIIDNVSNLNIDVLVYSDQVLKYYDEVYNFVNYLKLDENIKISDLNDIYNDYLKHQELVDIVKEYINIDEFNKETLDKNIMFLVRHQSINLDLNVNDKEIDDLINCYNELPKLGINDYYLNSTIKEFINLKSYDKSLINDYKEYEKYKLELANFLIQFEDGIYDFNDLDLIYEHSIYYEAVNEYLKDYDEYKLGVRNIIEDSLNIVSNNEKKELALNNLIIESLLYQDINKEEEIYRFLEGKGSVANLRLLFKEHSEAILKLKKTIIASPSTISLLFRDEHYDDFDVLIIDEASQVEMVELLPGLFRSKQVIIVGDEYQLPPIKQLVVTQDVESVISLALKKSLFKIYSLKCHYRSETESLIAYSRDRYYTEMLTFPSPEPFGNHLGLKDVYLEEANLDGGENISEAKTVVSLIKKHFDDFYDETKRCLDEEHSLGIITFGEAQSKLIEKLIYQDEELKTKITETVANYKDVSEKIFFIKTIRNVQGFEIAHLIISFTYGRSKSGEINNKFYNLGTKKLGECMFNVAVTRAQKEVIAVHSIRSYELKTENSQNIADYLESCERFEKFKVIDTNIYGYEANNGFEYNILNELIKAGVSKQNVLFNYGATGGSIRIPLVILDRTHSKVKCGLWLEKQTNIYYLDYNMHYYDILVDRGFKLYKVYLEDYMFNKEATLAKILSFIKESGGL